MMHNAPPPPAQTSEPLGVETPAADPAPGPKGPTLAALRAAHQAAVSGLDRLTTAANEIDTEAGHYDIDEAANAFAEARLFVLEGERAIQRARDMRGRLVSLSAAPPPAPIGPDQELQRAAVVGAAGIVHAKASFLLTPAGPLDELGGPSPERAALVEACRVYLRAVAAAEVFEVARAAT